MCVHGRDVPAVQVWGHVCNAEMCLEHVCACGDAYVRTGTDMCNAGMCLERVWGCRDTHVCVCGDTYAMQEHAWTIYGDTCMCGDTHVHMGTCVCNAGTCLGHMCPHGVMRVHVGTRMCNAGMYLEHVSRHGNTCRGGMRVRWRDMPGARVCTWEQACACGNTCVQCRDMPGAQVGVRTHVCMWGHLCATQGHCRNVPRLGHVPPRWAAWARVSPPLGGTWPRSSSPGPRGFLLLGHHPANQTGWGPPRGSS